MYTPLGPNNDQHPKPTALASRVFENRTFTAAWMIFSRSCANLRVADPRCSPGLLGLRQRRVLPAWDASPSRQAHPVLRRHSCPSVGGHGYRLGVVFCEHAWPVARIVPCPAVLRAAFWKGAHPAVVRVHFFSAGRKSSAAEFMQYRSPVGAGPSSNTCPRCASHLAQRTSARTIP